MDNTPSSPVDCQPLTPPDTEGEVMRNWTAEWHTPVVSVACVTYNHSAYIEDALNGFLAQQTDFPFEVIVRDDASTDGAQEIIRQYAERYPTIIKPHFEIENQRSKGVRPLPAAIRLTRGAYIALCDGDDYWTSPHKLQKQYDAMRDHPECELCFHKAIMIDWRDRSQHLIGAYRRRSGSITASSVVRQDSGMMPTAAMMISRRVAMRFVPLREHQLLGGAGDVLLQICAAATAGVYYVNETLSVYRKFSEGSWSEAQQTSGGVRLKKLESMIQNYVALKKLDEMTDRLAADVDYSIWRRVMIVVSDFDIDSSDKRRLVAENREYFGVISYACARLICAAPWCLKIARWFWVRIKPIRSGVVKAVARLT